MTFEVLLKQIVKEAVIEALHETKVKPTEEPKNWTTNDEPVKTTLQAPAPSKEVVESDDDVAVEETEISEVDLGSMKLKELREYAEELGINSKGKRAEVESRIQEFLNSEESEEEDLDEEVEDDVEEVEEESEEEDDEEDSDEDDEKYAQVKEYVENASDEEIKETLKELGLSTKGKREALIEKLYQAVKDGLFEFAEEDEEESEDVEDIEESEEESEDMTSERAEGIEELEEKVHADFESGDLTRKDMTTFLKQVGVAVTKKVDDDDVLEMYISKLALLVDDEGEFHEEGEDPYTINGVPYCCGAKLEVLEDGGYKCNVCGAEYDDEE